MASKSELIVKRGSLKGQLTRAANFLNSLQDPINVSKEQIETRMLTVSALLSQFLEINLNLDLIESTEEFAIENEQEANSFEDNYYSLIGRFKQILNRMSPVAPVVNASNRPVANGNANNIPVVLPKIELPKFSGSFSEYLSFYDSFNSLINENVNLNDCQKFHYLKSCLRGEALRCIESLTVSTANYQSALNILERRYKHERLIIYDHIGTILNFPPVSKAHGGNIRRLLDTLTVSLEALKILQLPVDTWDAFLVVLISSKLDFVTRKDFETNLTTEMPKLNELLSFLEKRCLFLESQNAGTSCPVKQQFQQVHDQTKAKRGTNPPIVKNVGVATNVKKVKYSCPLCRSSHSLFTCKEFLELPVQERLTKVRNLNLCVNCIRSGHQVAECTFLSCRFPGCNEKHNILLHIPAQSTVESTTVALSTYTNNFKVHDSENQILLSTAIIYVKDNSNVFHKCRALLDVGSQANIISSDLCKKLDLVVNKTHIPISGINQNQVKIDYATNISIKSLHNNFSDELHCLVLPKLTSNIPCQSFAINKIQIPERITLADPHFNRAEKIDLIIGAELFWKILCIGKIKPSAPGQPFFQKTHFGWVVGGPANVNQNSPLLCNVAALSLKSKSDLETAVFKFWELEEYQSLKPLTNEEKACENNFVRTTQRDDEGRFIVTLPIKNEELNLGKSDKLALKRFYSLERKLSKDRELKTLYTDFINEYVSLNHMQVVPDNEINNKNVFYLPHHAVIKPCSTSTKLRVVFDGSAQTTNGFSLNDNLLNGPVLQQDLFSILTRFRTFQYVINADITKMYRMIKLNSNQVDLQRLFWREDPDQPIKTYRLTTVTYGITSASFLAVRCLHQLADINKSAFPIASDKVLTDFYMDDLLTGASTIKEVAKLKNDISNILAQGGFTLCKWSSNVDNLSNEVVENNKINLDKNGDRKILGLWWNCREDSLKYEVSLTNDPPTLTKRYILSSVARIFDPLGLIGPVIAQAKLIMQSLWSINLGWDEPIPLRIKSDWDEFISHISHINELQIPRNVINFQSISKIELHAFSDASQKAYGTAIYIRTIDSLGNFNTMLLCSKSRVAPLKTISIPRLELCGALIAARLTSKILKTINLKFDQLYFWTDSTVVLAWLAELSSNWCTFVANRVGEIQDLTNFKDWNHVNTSDNPADIISRGALGSQLLNSELWWQGPSWLSQDSTYWPHYQITVNKSELPERKKTPLTVSVATEDFNLLNKFSNYSKLQRVMAYCLRFVHNCRVKVNKNSGALSLSELRNSNNSIIKIVQLSDFHTELKTLKESSSVNKNSKLYSLSPFLDEHGLIRVGGRLANSSITYDKKFPLILPNKHYITKLIIRQTHERQLHAGAQATLSALRQNYWILSGRDVIRKIIHQCMKCYRCNPSINNPKMGNLPSSRVEPIRPFIKSGVDYAGPILIKESTARNSRKVKSYIALFVCFATKAVHLELVGNMSTESFLAALKRFISRRGHVSDLYSDNGSNFVGASNEFKKFINSNKFNDEVCGSLNSININWHFIPSRSPHMGGIWEAGIKAAKQHLKRVIGDASLNYEEMYTMLTQIEACLNSRPLIPLTHDPTDLSALTPGHFLIGDVLTSPLEPDLRPINPMRLARWQRIEQIRQHFWSRWSREYLSQLQQRSKWKGNSTQRIEIGTLVLLKQDNLPPLQWSLGRVTHLIHGTDNFIRVVKVKTLNGTVTRAVNKISVLPISD